MSQLAVRLYILVPPGINFWEELQYEDYSELGPRCWVLFLKLLLILAERWSAKDGEQSVYVSLLCGLHHLWIFFHPEPLCWCNHWQLQPTKEKDKCIDCALENKVLYMESKSSTGIYQSISNYLTQITFSFLFPCNLNT